MKQNRHICVVLGSLALLLALWTLVPPCSAEAQVVSSWWGTSSWWDWSDFRAYAGVRLFLPRVTGNVEARGESHSFTDFGIIDDPELFKSFFAEFYVDRLGLRFEVEEDHKFRGRREEITTNGSIPLGPKISELDMSTNKLGVDLDIIRYPFARAGVNFTYHLERVKFQDRRNPNANLWYQYTGSQPLTIGVHGRAIPVRVRDVPVTIQARLRIPVPFVHRPTEAKVTEWEISGGLRPSIWSTSLFGHSTFSFGIEGGYRVTYLKMFAEELPRDPGNPASGAETHVTARWSGAFIQAILVY